MIKVIKIIFTPVYFLFMFILNRIINYIPLRQFRKLCFRCMGMRIGLGSQIDMGQYFLAPYRIKIGKTSHINQGCILDGRGELSIGNNVSISHRCALITGSHDIDSKKFSYITKPIRIDDYVFVGVNATILQGVIIGRGSVVCAGSVVTKDVPELSIVAGIPAKVIGYRKGVFDYNCKPDYWFL